MTANKKLKVTLVRSKHGRKPGHAETVTGLGLSRIHTSVVLADTPQTRGMVNKISYLLRVEEGLNFERHA